MVADDHLHVRRGLLNLMNLEPDIEVIAEACDGQEAVQLARSRTPEVVIMDVNMPVLDGITATRMICSEKPGIQVIGLSMMESDHVRKSLLAAGAKDCLSKTAPIREILDAIREAVKQPRI